MTARSGRRFDAKSVLEMYQPLQRVVHAYQKITDFFWRRKRKPDCSENGVQEKVCRNDKRLANQPTPPIFQFPQEVLWEIVAWSHWEDMVNFSRSCRRAQQVTHTMIRRRAHMKQIGDWFHDSVWTKSERKLAKFLARVLINDNCEIFRHTVAIEWLLTAERHRCVPMPFMVEAFLSLCGLHQKLTLLHRLVDHWFARDLHLYIQHRLQHETRPHPLEHDLYVRFRRLLHRQDLQPHYKALVTSAVIKRTVEKRGWPRRVHYIIVLALFGPRLAEKGKWCIDFENLENDRVHLSKLLPLSECFSLLRILDAGNAPKPLLWTKREIFALLEDVTTCPMWSMGNFVSLLHLRPYLALITVTVRVDSGLIREAAAVLFHLLKWANSADSKIQLAEYIFSSMERADAGQLHQLVRGYSLHFVVEPGNERHAMEAEVMRTALDVAYENAFNAEPDTVDF